MIRGALLAIGIAAALSCRRPAPGELYSRAERESAQSRWTEALETLSSAPDEPRFRLLRAEILLGKGERAAAEALLPATPYADPELEARRLMHRGRAAILRGDGAAAMSALEEARALALPLHRPPLLAAIELRRALELGRRGEFEPAMAAGRYALEVARREGNREMELQASGNLGFVSLNAHRYEEAIAWFDRVRALTGEAGHLEKAIGNAGLAWWLLGDLDRAAAAFAEAEPLAAKAGQRFDQMVWIGQAGALAYHLGQRERALDHFRRALAISTELETAFTATWEHDLALVLLDLGRPGEAAERIEAAARAADPSDVQMRVLLEIARGRLAEARSEFPAAIEWFQKAAAEPRAGVMNRQSALGLLAALYSRMGRPAEAEAQYRAMAALGEAQRASLREETSRLSYGGSVAQVYAAYADFLMERGRVEDAAGVVAANRARMLGEGRGLGAADLVGLARRRGAVILLYSLGPRRSWLWAVTGAGVAAHPLPGEPELRDLVARHQRFIEALRDPRTADAPARDRLSALLLEPARAALPAGVRVYLAPDGVLQSLNFETLRSPVESGRYWIEDATVSVVPSFVRVLGTGARGAGRRLLAAGAPDPQPEPYQALPYAAEEVRSIAAAWPGGAETLSGAECVRERVLGAGLGEFGYLHFALHAVANRLDPLHSALILARSEGGSTITAAEIGQMKLRAELVTLSACRGAGARTYSGEGLVGLSWAFLEAGAQGVVGGLWDVNDQSTAALMTRLYAGLARGESPAAALREAKLAMLAPGGGAQAKPYYWAPFLYYDGAGRP